MGLGKEKKEDTEKIKNNEPELNQEETKKKDTEPKKSKLSELDIIKAKNDELNENLLRSFAEFDNFKKRTIKEKEEMTIYAKMLCIKDILAVIDNFERALAADCKDEDFKKGMAMIFTQLNETMKKLGVEEIEAINQKFDPEMHNAINQIEDPNFDDNTICQVMQKGYKIANKVIRHAMVVVANP